MSFLFVSPGLAVGGRAVGSERLDRLPGHAPISITTEVYGHLVGTVASDAVNCAANLIARTVHTPEAVSA
jgi:hypothetical protein